LKPHQLIGLPYRLGADPEKHGALDCVSLSRTVLKYYGIKSPEPTRQWYRRLKRKDYSIFREQLELWGIRTKTLRLGTVGLCKSKAGYGLAVYWAEGWLNICEESGAKWSPIEALQVVDSYYPQKQNFVKSLV